MSSLTKQERTAKIGEIVEKVTQMTDENKVLFMIQNLLQHLL